MIFLGISSFLFISKFNLVNAAVSMEFKSISLLNHDKTYCLDSGDWAMSNSINGIDYGVYTCDQNNYMQKLYYYDETLRNYNKTLCLDGIEDTWRFRECNGGGTQQFKLVRSVGDLHLIWNQNNGECFDSRKSNHHSPCTLTLGRALFNIGPIDSQEFFYEF
jgi:hypothetical protein